jgi:DNA-binding transcriptional MerR regulator
MSVALDGDEQSFAAEAGPARAVARQRPPKLYRIGEIVDYSGLSRQTVHNYTIMGLLHEARWTEGGHRLYDESVFARLDVVAELKASGKSLVEIRERCAALDKEDGAEEEVSENA